MEKINGLDFEVLKGERFVVITINDTKHFLAGYDFIDSLLNKGYELTAINSISMGTGYIAYLKK